VQIVVREAEAGDEGFLWRMLLEAAHAGDEVDGVEALRQVPELARYVEGWGRPSDLGVVATNGDGEPVGAAWVRMLVGEDAAYGYVDDTTPELAIAVDPQRTGDGIGSQLLKRLLLDAERRQVPRGQPQRPGRQPGPPPLRALRLPAGRRPRAHQPGRRNLADHGPPVHWPLSQASSSARYAASQRS